MVRVPAVTQGVSESSLPPAFCPHTELIGGVLPIWGRPVHFTQSTQTLRPSRNSRSRTPELMFNQLRGHPVVRSGGHIKLTLTVPVFVYVQPSPEKAHAKWIMVFASGENIWEVGGWGQGERDLLLHLDTLWYCSHVLFFTYIYSTAFKNLEQSRAHRLCSAGGRLRGECRAQEVLEECLQMNSRGRHVRTGRGKSPGVADLPASSRAQTATSGIPRANLVGTTPRASAGPWVWAVVGRA